MQEASMKQAANKAVFTACFMRALLVDSEDGGGMLLLKFP
jgi:hypothetical protein